MTFRLYKSGKGNYIHVVYLLEIKQMTITVTVGENKTSTMLISNAVKVSMPRVYMALVTLFTVYAIAMVCIPREFILQCYSTVCRQIGTGMLSVCALS